MADATLVFPGDELGVAEQFLPGDGTYEEDGLVYAARMGHAHLDPKEFSATVRPVTKTPPTLEVGDVIVGRVVFLKKSFASVEIVANVEDADRKPLTSERGTLHISKIADYYLDQIEDAFRLGDVIRAKVIETEPAIQLLTKYPEYGALLARCPECRAVMEGKGQGLVCPECEWKSRAKLAADYGSGYVRPPGDIQERMEQRKKEHREQDISFPPRPKYTPEGDGGRRSGGGRKGGRKRN